MNRSKASYPLVLFACLFAVGVIVLGAYTRLVDAGLGCPDWPTCYGHLGVPSTDAQIARAQELFPEAPFEAHKAWPEVIHRYLASGLGLLIIVITAAAWRHRQAPGQPLKLPLFLLALVIAQGLFGMWTVTLKLWPQVVTAHLLGGFTTLSLLWILALRLENRPWPQPHLPLRHWIKLKPLAVLGLLALIVQIALGGWVSSNYAALACPDLPTCQNQWLPAMDFANGFNVFQEIGPNYLGGQLDGEARVAIHVTHRIGALLVSIVLLLLIWRMRQNAGGSQPMLRLANVMLFLLALQVALGLSNVAFGLPLAVAVAHNAVGALLLLSLVTLNYRLNRSTVSGNQLN